MISLITRVGSLLPMPDVPPITPNFDGPGTQAVAALSGQAAGLGLTILGLLVVLFAVLFAISFSTRSTGLRMLGGVGILCCVVAATFIASAAGFINFGNGIDLIP